MDRLIALEFVRQAMALPGVNRSTIARALGIDPSQVSRIAAGRFVKLDGHALKVCKYAQHLVQDHGAHSGPSSFADVECKLARLSAINPWAARAVSDLIDALAEG
ncbi:hypothetical protein [Luteimonas sp. R10]|uniref:hypothetical protein n=1 Tax=Luteimonas sp. R10 TaxID=3108176 RepID=UPI003091CDD6|nr:hypothetical protein U3649_15140 [Luteimonas sp. R10]